MDTMKVNPFHITDVKALKINGTEVTATAAELNAGVLGGVASMTTATTPAETTCAVQLVFKDADGEIMAVPTSGLLYLSEDSAGLGSVAADTSLAVLTNGVVTNLVAHSVSHFITTAAGLLGLTISAATDSYWIVVVLPSGKLLISDECVVSGA